MSSDVAGIRRRLLLAREAAKLTQHDVATELAVTRQTVSRWEHGGPASPSLEQLRDLCVLLGVTPSYLLFGVGVLPEIINRAMQRVKNPTPTE